MRAWIVALMLVAACKSGGKKGPAAAQEANKLNLPKVATASVLAADVPPPFLLLVDDHGAVRVSAAASWTDVAMSDIAAKAKTAPIDAIDRFIREAYGLGQQPVAALATWDPKAEVDLQTLDDTRINPADMQDDPPPPPPEDMPDDGADESGGTGTAMALDEGKMGKKDSDRAEGQYKMKMEADDPQIVRRRQMGMRGPMGAFAALSSKDGTPTRLAEVAGEVSERGKLDGTRAAILAPPTLKAQKLIELVTRMEAAIAVVHDGTVRPLRINFARDHDSAFNDPKYWLEARVSAKGVVIEAVPDAPIETGLEPKALAAAIDKARTARGVEPFAPIDVLVDADVDAQRLVDVLVALDTAGVRMIGMGNAPSADEMKLRGHRIPTVSIGRPNVQGDLDKGLVRNVVIENHSKFLDCYTKALATAPDLKGTVMAQFFITPKGTVATVATSGVDPGVATCVQGVIKALVFPKPKGGGGVQVNYPFTMRP